MREDKNICFNADQFSDLKGLVNCGYATIKVKYSNKLYAFNNCFTILDDNIDFFRPYAHHIL